MAIGVERRKGEVSLSDRIGDYLPNNEVLAAYPLLGPLEKDRKEYSETKLPGGIVSLKRDTTSYSEFDIIPTWHPVNTVIPSNPGLHYAHIGFEGGSLRPVVDDNGEIISANLILHEARMNRFRRSIASIGMQSNVSEDTLKAFDQGIVDLSAVLATKVLQNDEGECVDDEGNQFRGYVRPWGFRVSGIGVTPLPTDLLDLGASIARMGRYLPKEAFEDGAKAGAFLGIRRDAKIRGKVGGNYTHAGDIGKKARELGLHEAAIWAPYWIDPSDGQAKPFDPIDEEIAMQQALDGGLLADGPGEDLVFFDRKGTLLYQPMNTNILGGTTRSYITQLLVPSMGIEVQERPVTINDLRSGEIVGAAYVGNAVGFCGVREFGIFGPSEQLIETISLEITDQIQDITKRYASELSGQVETVGPLLTPVDIKDGEKARKKLLKSFSGWF